MLACKKSYSFDRVFLGLYLTVPQTPKAIWTSRKEIFFTLLTQCTMVTWDVGELVLLMKKTHREERLEWFRAGWSKWSISWKHSWFIVDSIETKAEWNARVAGESWAGIGSACFRKLKLRKIYFFYTFLFRAEQEILLRRSLALVHGDEYKLSGRRSFFRRSKKGTHGSSVNHSREGSDSATSITTSCTGMNVRLESENSTIYVQVFQWKFYKCSNNQAE